MLGVLTNRSGLSLIGLDIGRRGLRAVQLVRPSGRGGSRRDGQWELFKAFCWDRQSGHEPAAVTDRADEADAGLVSLFRSPERCRETGERLGRLLRQNEFRSQELVVGLSSPALELHALEIPSRDQGAGSGADVRQAVRWELQRLMSFPEGRVETDFWWLPAPDGAADGARRARGDTAAPPGQPTAIGVVAERRTVRGVWSVSEAARLGCRRLDAGACALSRFGAWLRGLEYLSGDGPGRSGQPDVWGLLDLGDAQLRLVICVDAVPVLVRSFDAGGSRWITHIAESLGLSAAAAEIHLRDHGIQLGERRKEGQGLRREDGPASSARLRGIIRNILRTELDALCGEIERSYRYAMQCYPARQVSELILVGGGAQVRGLDDYLGDKLGITVQTASNRLENTAMAARGGAGTPFMRPGVGGRYAIGSLACAIGLALPPDDPERRATAGAPVAVPADR